MSRTRAVALAAMVPLFALSGAGPAFAQSTRESSSDTTLIAVGAVTAGAALFLLIAVLFGPNAAVESDLRGRLGSYLEEDDDNRWLKRVPLLRRFVSKAEVVAEERGLLTTIERALEQANLPLRPGEAIAGAIASAILVGLLAGVVTRSLIGAIVGAGFSLLIAGAAVQSIANRERKRFESQLPDTLNLISTSLRAGYSLLQAVEAVAQEAPEPTAREFNRAMTETRLGRPPTEALKDVADRMQSTDFDWAVLAIGIQREVGGNLAEVLQTAAETMLQRNRLRREMKALTAEGRISAIVLGSLPFFLFAFLWTTNRDYLQPLLESTGGIIAIVGVLFMLLTGIYWLTRIVKVDV
ncbi:MAG: type II secretion system F family protein [Acidimicrobiia bacterium]